MMDPLPRGEDSGRIISAIDQGTGLAIQKGGESIDNRARGNGLETVTCAALLSVLTSNIRSSYPRFRYVLARNEQLCCLLRFVYYAKT